MESVIASYGPVVALVMAFLAVYGARRKDDTEVVGQMKSLIDEVQEERDGLRRGLAEVSAELAKCRACRADLERELGRLRRG